ncbi:hypothetical protein [Aeoliella sp. SH292]|uniref:hypothetical protein n=1 Tax=Aeoliella sp. SH292 TaxID=3454464 RepID=UPI003F9E0527
MTEVEAIQSAIDALTPHDLAILRSWFEERDWERWDRDIERDSDSGRLDFLIDEAKQAAARNELGEL